MPRAELQTAAATGGRPHPAGASCPPYPWLAIVAHHPGTPHRESPPPSGSPASSLTIDRQSREIHIGPAWIELTFREFELLDFLASNPGRVFSREQLLRQVWRREPAGPRTVDVHVHRLRRKLGASHGQCLVTVRRVGYKFTPSDPQRDRPAALAPCGC